MLKSGCGRPGSCLSPGCHVPHSLSPLVTPGRSLTRRPEGRGSAQPSGGPGDLKPGWVPTPGCRQVSLGPPASPTLPRSGAGGLEKERGWGARGSSWADTRDPPRCPATVAAPARLPERILSEGQRSRRRALGHPWLCVPRGGPWLLLPGGWGAAGGGLRGRSGVLHLAPPRRDLKAASAALQSGDLERLWHPWGSTVAQEAAGV